MSVKSMFEFKFPEKAQQEGLKVCKQIGQDMIVLGGYLGHEVLQDLKDPGHMTVNTHWSNQETSSAVLSTYQHGETVKRATELIGSEPSGFVATVLD